MKKLVKENPIAHFRKANEARKAVVVKSLKKAQEGIAQDTTAAQQPVNKYSPWKENVKLKNPENPAYEKRPSYMEPTREYADPKINPNYNSNPPASSQFSGSQALSARLAEGKKKKGSVKK